MDDGSVHEVTHCAASKRSYGRPAQQHERVPTPNPWRHFTQFAKANVPTAFPEESACADANRSQSISCALLSDEVREHLHSLDLSPRPPPFREGYEMQPPTVMFISRSGTSVNPPVDLNKRIASLIKPTSNSRSLKSLQGTLYSGECSSRSPDRTASGGHGAAAPARSDSEKNERHGQIECL